MTTQRFRRRGFLLATGATLAGCLGDGGDEDGDDPTGNGTDGDSTPPDGNASAPVDGIDCEILTERYVRHEPGASPFVFTAEIPATEGKVYTVEKRYWEMQIEKDVGAYQAELRLRQAGPRDELPAKFRGEGEDPIVGNTTFDGVEVPIMRHTAQDRPQFYTGIPVPGAEDAYVTVVTSLDIRGPGDIGKGACTDAGNAVQMHAIETLEPNGDHELEGGGTTDGSGAGGNATSG